MKQVKAKLMALLMTLGCLFACVGAGIAVTEPQKTAITVNAEEAVTYTTYTAKKIGGWIAGAATYLYSVEGDAFPKGGEDWSTVYTFEAGSGDGMTYNGEPFSTADIKQPGDFYIGLGKTPATGDIFTIDGTYYNETKALKFVFVDCKVKFDGTKWVEYVPYTEYNLGALALHRYSKENDSIAQAGQLYLERADGNAVPFAPSDWETKFTLESGEGWKLNGTPVTVGPLVSTSGFVFADVSAANVKVGDVLSVSGTFVCEAEQAKYVIAESSFTWNGKRWKKTVTYTTNTIGSLTFHKWTTGSNHVYFKAEKSIAVPQDGNSGWTATFLYKDGVGVTVNGVQVDVGQIKFPSGSMFVNINNCFSNSPQAPVAGDVLVVGGTFYNNELALQYVITESTFKWDGSTWVLQAAEPEVPPTIEYTTYTATKLGGWIDGASTYLYSAEGDEFPKGGEDWSTVYKFEAGSGDGMTYNGEPFSTADIKQPGDFYIGLGKTPATGDIFTIDGTYYNETKALKFVFVDCKVQFNGTKWVEYVETPPVEYTTHNLGKLAMHGNGGSATCVYLQRADGGALAFEAWENPFVLESGDGLKVNGAAVAMSDMQSSDAGLYVAFEKVGAVTVISISGTFRCDNQLVKYVIEESKFVWNGKAWENYDPCKEYDFGKLGVHNNSSGANSNTPSATALYMKIANGTAIPYPDGKWETEFTLESGAGWKLNGEDVTSKITDIESTNNGLYVNLSQINVQVGDTLCVEGTFYSEDVNAKYIIAKTSFLWNGTAWESYVDYTTIELGTLAFDKVESDNKFLYLTSASGVIIPEDGDWVAYQRESGLGVIINDVVVAATVKFPGCVFIEFSTAPSLRDKLTIGGVFYNENKEQKFVIEETTLWFNGTAWATEDPTDAYTPYNLGEMYACWPSSSVGDATATQLYLKRLDGQALPFPDSTWETEFIYKSGIGVRLNGMQISIADLESTNAGLFLQLSGAGVQVGDVITIGGTYYCVDEAATYTIQESKFMWNGEIWLAYVTEGELENYDVVSLPDIGLGMEQTISGTIDKYTQLAFSAGENNTTNSVAFRFGYRSADTAAGNLCFRLRGGDWQGVKFWIAEGKIVMVDSNKSYPLASNTDYIIEIGAISMTNGKVWTYVKLDDMLVLSEAITTSQFQEFKDFATTGFTNRFSMYASSLAETKLTDSGSVSVTFASSAGSYKVMINRANDLTLPTGKSTQTFIGWVYDGKLYQAGETFGKVESGMTFTAVEVDFAMEAGAAIRISDTTNNAGIRFTSRISEAAWNKLLNDYDVAEIRYGTLIMPYDFLGDGQVPNLKEFEEDTQILNIKGENANVENSYVVIRGAMRNLYEGNYARLFAGRAYVEIVLEDGTAWTVYTPFSHEDNVRSIRQVAIAFEADTSTPSTENELRYTTITDEQRAVVDSYIAVEGISLMNYDAYANNAASVIAWNYPELDPANGYMNDANYAIADQMKAAGVKVVGLTGENMVFMNNVANIEKTRQIIKFFDSQGLQTFAFAANTGGYENGEYKNMNLDLSQNGYPDFSDCEGFIGFLAWDEPSNSQVVMDKIAAFAEEFEKKYAGTDVIFMANLLPSYAAIFNGDNPNFWESNMDVLDKDGFRAYLQQYCDTVLSKVSGTKWLSLDSYPINADGSLMSNFLFDLAMLKYYAEANDAHSHVVLQSSGWQEGAATGKARIPTEAEMRMQVYAAMAFGIDSFSWFTYSPSHMSEKNTYYTPVDENGNIIDETAYNALKTVNAEVEAIGKVYNAFTWKGIILGTGKDNGKFFGADDADYEAYNAVKGEIGDYELTASDTKYLASVATNKTNWNYLMSVMEDAHGNEGYVLCNYNSHEEDRAQTITITFASNITEVIIYRGGVAETMSVSNKTLQVNLATGEGVIILPSKLS